MQSTATPIGGASNHPGTGGFLDPEKIVNGFGVEEGMRIADFGCGAGYFTIILAEKVGSGGRVYAFDIIESVLDVIRTKARYRQLDNIEAIRTNLEIAGGSGLPDNSQDIVLLANIIFQSKKKGDIIKEGVRILKKGGEMIIIDWENNSGGFGPPNGFRADKSNIRSIAEGEGLSFDGDLATGSFHFGMVFKKPKA